MIIFNYLNYRGITTHSCKKSVVVSQFTQAMTRSVSSVSFNIPLHTHSGLFWTWIFPDN